MLLYTLALSALVAGALGAAPFRPIPESRLVGKPTTIDVHPHQVSFEFFENEKYNHWCSGSIIGKNWVLTAAHCVAGIRAQVYDKIKVRAGTTYKEREGIKHAISGIFLHPNFTTWFYDAALVKVAEPFLFSDNVKAIQMVTESPAPGSPVLTTYTGWALNRINGTLADQLQELEVKVVDRDVCNEVYKELDPVTESMVCVVFPELDGGRCDNDSGGPLVSDGELAGIASSTVRCSLTEYPRVFVDVAQVRSWVSSVTENN